MRALTDSQREVLEAVHKLHELVSLPKLAATLDRPAEGLGQTAASLVRRGLLRRWRLGRHVAYSITERGAGVLGAPRTPAVTVRGPRHGNVDGEKLAAELPGLDPAPYRPGT